MTVIERLAQKFGSKAEIARALGVDPAQITRWDYRGPHKKQGHGIPSWHMQRLVKEAGKRGIELTLDDFMDDAP